MPNQHHTHHRRGNGCRSGIDSNVTVCSQQKDTFSKAKRYICYNSNKVYLQTTSHAHHTHFRKIVTTKNKQFAYAITGNETAFAVQVQCALSLEVATAIQSTSTAYEYIRMLLYELSGKWSGAGRKFGRE